MINIATSGVIMQWVEVMTQGINNYFPYLYNACAKNNAFDSTMYATARPPANLKPSLCALVTSNIN